MDIGSSLVALPLGTAEQAGVNPDNARRGGVNAANGLASAPAETQVFAVLSFSIRA